jgi:acetolactate synthase I/II/III large subunit
MAKTAAETVTGGDALVETMLDGGVDVVFGLPGVQLDAAFDALARRLDRARVYHTRHEQATSYMADGFARVTGRPACCLVVPGPGVMNAMAGLATAYACNSPVLCVAGQIRSDAIDEGIGLLHEVPHQTEMLRSAVKFATRAMRPEEIPARTTEALARAMEGRRRPVAVEIPHDVLEAPLLENWTSPTLEPPAEPAMDSLDEVAEVLRRAERPLVIAGGGILAAEAWDELREVAERLQAPVVVTVNGKGALDTEHPLACEAMIRRQLARSADVVLAVGTRLALTDYPGGHWRPDPGQRLVRIDVDPVELARDGGSAVLVRAGARQALARLAELLPPRPQHPWHGWEVVRDRFRAQVAALQPQAAFGAAIRRALPDDVILIAGMTQLGYWSRLGLPVRRPRTYIGPGYQGTLGFEVPTGLGAQIGAPHTRVVVLAGDGGFMFNVQELATAVQHRIPAIFVVFDDGAYGNVSRIQAARFEGRTIASHLQNPDFCRLADSFGLAAFRADGPEALERALRRALDVDGPVMIHVPVGEMADPWMLIAGRMEEDEAGS